MDRDQIDALRDILAPTRWLARSREFATGIRTAGHHAGGLLIVGTPTVEPWHLTAHLADEARYAGLPELAPTLVRWQPPPGAPPHLAIGLERLEHAAKGETLFVVAADLAPDALLERVNDARKIGAVIFSLDRGDQQLQSLAHDALSVPDDEAVSFDIVSHLVSAAAGDTTPHGRGMRHRLASLLNSISGTPNR